MSDTWFKPQILSRRQPGWKEGKGKNFEEVKGCSGQKEQLMERLRGGNNSPCTELHKGEGRSRRKRTPDSTKNLECQAEGLRPSRGQQGATEGSPIQQSLHSLV